MENRIAKAYEEMMHIEYVCYERGEVERARGLYKVWEKRWKAVRTGEAGNVLTAYKKSKENENDILVVRKMNNAKKFANVLKENGINEFAFIYDRSDAVLKLAELCEEGCKVAGRKVVNGEKDFSGKREKIVGVLITL